METLRQRLAEQKGRHQGGSKWIGTAGTSPFGAYGYNPEGVRIGQDESRNNRARSRSGTSASSAISTTRVELGTRNIKLALRRCASSRARAPADELDLDDTIRSTAHNAGWLDLKMVPERHNAVKVLLFLDVGGSMDDHVRTCEELFSAARAEFKHLEYFYFHNCLYEALWRDARRRHVEQTPTMEVLRTYDAELQADLRRRRQHEPLRDRPARRQRRALERRAGRGLAAPPARRPIRRRCGSTRCRSATGPARQSIGMIRQIMEDRMFPLTLDGLDRGDAATDALGKPNRIAAAEPGSKPARGSPG